MSSVYQSVICILFTLLINYKVLCHSWHRLQRGYLPPPPFMNGRAPQQQQQQQQQFNRYRNTQVSRCSQGQIFDTFHGRCFTMNTQGPCSPGSVVTGLTWTGSAFCSRINMVSNVLVRRRCMHIIIQGTSSWCVCQGDTLLHKASGDCYKEDTMGPCKPHEVFKRANGREGRCQLNNNSQMMSLPMTVSPNPGLSDNNDNDSGPNKVIIPTFDNTEINAIFEAEQNRNIIDTSRNATG